MDIIQQSQKEQITTVPLSILIAGTQVIVGGNRVLTVSKELADTFQKGDMLRAVEESDDILHIPTDQQRIVGKAVGESVAAFSKMETVSDEQISSFFTLCATHFESDDLWNTILEINGEDVIDAKKRGRSTTRLVADERLRRDIISGLHGWADTPSRRGEIFETITHDGWQVDLQRAALGVVGFVFEGRPNVVADAVGVLRSGNTVVFRIGRDALRTAQAMLGYAITPALREAGLPEGAVSLVESPSHAAGWALFSDTRLALAVARGSGRAVRTLGSLARQAGIAVSLHGTGGAWMVVSEYADKDRFAKAVFHSLDRKVCNTLNTCCIVQSRAKELVPVLLASLKKVGDVRGHDFKLHVVSGDEQYVPKELFEKQIVVTHSSGVLNEAQAELQKEQHLAHEWEWEENPEITLKIVADVDEAIMFFNTYSPQFVASLISEDEKEQSFFYKQVNAPFVCNGFTRWVDGQYALNRPELGLSNWQHGRLLGRAGVLNGDSMFTVRMRVRQDNPDVGR